MCLFNPLSPSPTLKSDRFERLTPQPVKTQALGFPLKASTTCCACDAGKVRLQKANVKSYFCARIISNLQAKIRALAEFFIETSKLTRRLRFRETTGLICGLQQVVQPPIHARFLCRQPLRVL